MFAIYSRDFGGESRVDYWFDFYDKENIDIEDGGVYIVAKYSNIPTEIKSPLIYIGETENIKKDFKNHIKENCFSENDYNCIGIHRETEKRVRLAILDDLCKRHKPKCNDNY